MSLNPLTFREKVLYRDFCTAYIEVNAATATPSLNSTFGNNTNSWTIAPLSDTDNTLLSNFPCNLHANPNFDEVRGEGGLNKVVNLVTSNELTCQRQIMLLSTMRLFITTRYGDSQWYKIQGQAEQEVLVPCTCVYIVPDKPPILIT
jgi:hypothetical protein